MTALGAKRKVPRGAVGGRPRDKATRSCGVKIGCLDSALGAGCIVKSMESRDALQLICIGEFARLGGVSIKALRLYAELGLLPPAVVKPQSRYRLYSRSQLPRVHRILLLKNAGFALAEIGVQLSHRDEATMTKIRARLLDRAEEIQRQLGWVDAELRAAARVVVKRVPKLEVWSRRQWIAQCHLVFLTSCLLDGDLGGTGFSQALAGAMK